MLVRNNTRVLPARLIGRREATGGHWEGLFLRALPAGTWEILATTRGRPAVGEHVVVGDGEGSVLNREAKPAAGSSGPRASQSPADLFGKSRYGQVPLPPYIRKGP